MRRKRKQAAVSTPVGKRILVLLLATVIALSVSGCGADARASEEGESPAPPVQNQDQEADGLTVPEEDASALLHLYLSVCRVKLYAVNVLSVSFNSPFMLSDNELAVMEEISLRLLAVSSMEAVKAVMSSFL